MLFFTSLNSLLANDGKDSLYSDFKETSVLLSNIHPQLVFEEQADLLTESITISSDPGDSIQHFINQGRAAIEKVRALGNYITSIDEATQFELPVGLKKAIPGLTWDLAIHPFALNPLMQSSTSFLNLKSHKMARGSCSWAAVSNTPKRVASWVTHASNSWVSIPVQVDP